MKKNLYHNQYNRYLDKTQKEYLYSFIGYNPSTQKWGNIRSWEQYGIGFVNNSNLTSPVIPLDNTQALRLGFSMKQITDAHEVLYKVNGLKLKHINTDLELVNCQNYQPIAYISNNNIYYNAITSKDEKYSEENITSLYLSCEKGSNNITKQQLLFLIKPIVKSKLLSEQVDLKYLPLNKKVRFHIDEVIKNNRFMSQSEIIDKFGLFQKYFVKKI